MLSRNLLQRLAKGWHKRSRVRSAIDMDITYDNNKDDFLDNLLPFATHPFYLAALPEIRTKVLSCGWMIYNAKTIAIETDIVHPVCLNLLNEKFPGTNDFLIKQLVTETMVDESYHIHLCVYANEITKQHRHLSITTPAFAFIQKMKIRQTACAEKWQQDLVQLATAITSEIYITDYLELVQDDKNNLQPLNQLIVKTHRSDELAHGKIFNYLAQMIFQQLTQREKLFFIKVINDSVYWLMDFEWSAWLSILQQIGFKHADKMIADCRSKYQDHPIKLPNHKGIHALKKLTEQLIA